MPEYPYIPAVNTPVWIANHDGTTERRWVEWYDPALDVLYLRSVQSQKVWNNGLRAYPGNVLGKTVFGSYQEARRAAKKATMEVRP